MDEPLQEHSTSRHSIEGERERGHSLFKKTFGFFLILFIIGSGYWLGYENGKASRVSETGVEERIPPEEAIIINKGPEDRTIDFALFWKVWELLKDKYVFRDELDARKLFYGAIDGMLAATGDPYTTFFSPEEQREFQEEISGTFEGIGAEMGMKNDVLTIVAPLEGTPAEAAGLQPDDKVIEIDGTTTVNMSLDEAVRRIRGKKGTEVTLTIFRNGEEETREVTVRRDVIQVKSVRFEMKPGNIAYIRLSRFGDDTEREFRAAVRQTQNSGAKGVILDMRNNPGGYLDTAIKLGSTMLPSGKIIVIEENAAKERREHKARGGDMLSQLPTVVLINEGSASASEILAGALRENREDVTLVGKKSFGKGSVQEMVSISRDSSVKITVAHWLTPNGNQIDKSGITPDIEVSLSREDIENKRDPQLDRAIETLNKKINE